MQNDQARIRIDLTDDQKRQVKEAAGHEISALEFSVEELEQRIAPGSLGNITFSKLADGTSNT